MRLRALSKFLIYRIALAIELFLQIHFGFETAALLDGVGEFAEAIGEFDAAGIELEAFGDAGVMGARAGQGGLDGGIFVKNGNSPIAEIGLDFFDQNAAENIGPGIPIGELHRALFGESVAIRLHCRSMSTADRRPHIF